MLSISSLIFLLSFSITLIDGGNVVRWNRYGRRVEKWGVYPDSCYVSCNDKRLTSTLYVAENDEKCMSWANFVTRDYSTFNLMELTNWRHICTQKVIKLYIFVIYNLIYVVFFQNITLCNYCTDINPYGNFNFWPRAHVGPDIIQETVESNFNQRCTYYPPLECSSYNFLFYGTCVCEKNVPLKHQPKTPFIGRAKI